MGMTEHARASREDELPGGKALCAGLMDEDAARAEGDAVGPGEAVDGGEHRSSGTSAGFTVIIKAIRIPDAPGPTVMRGIRDAAFLDLSSRHFGGSDGKTRRNEAGFFDFDGKGCWFK